MRLALVAALAQLALGQSEQKPAQATSASTTSASAPQPKRKVIRLEAITVEGRIQKPQAFYILQRSQLNFDELNKTESFIPKVVKSVDQDAF